MAAAALLLSRRGAAAICTRGGVALLGARRLSSAAVPPSAERIDAAHLPLLSIIGAPNAGKSTLFNRLTRVQSSFRAFRPQSLVTVCAR